VIAAVLFDLDDTLYEQGDWLAPAWSAVAAAAAPYGIDRGTLEAALLAVAAGGSDRGQIIDRALARVGADGVPLAPLLAAFRASVPAQIAPYPGVREALERLRREVPIGLVTDGDVAIQRAKLRALELDDAFDVVVLSDALGRARRKPHPAPFNAALTALGEPARDVVHVGDRPEKDVRGAAAAGIRAIRVRTGEYAARPDHPLPWRTARDMPAAVALVLALGVRARAAG
jgi:HAD superfamily hydrolase (TIGR01509 family)